ncbi:MAG: hypothetical protein HUU16_17395 [Candidatus Omnitrophica bacterium]|nr:hypothetical protein [Candidatus Omnitrophota bacterium]
MSISPVFLALVSANLLVNPDFEKGLDGWRTEGNEARFEVVEREGGRAARMIVPSTATVGWPQFFQEFEVNEGDILKASGRVLGKDIRDGAGAYFSFNYLDPDGKRISFSQGAMLIEQGTWRELSVEGVAPPDSVRVRFSFNLNGHGEAFLDEVILESEPGEPLPPMTGEVVLTVTDRRSCGRFRGFGAEDDGWFYNPTNAEKGVTEADWRIREDRIRWMDPDWQRMFFWHRDWCPSEDWKTFTFDSPNMESHYRTLSLYQELGAAVNVVGVEWGMKDPYGDPAGFVHALGELLEHLIKIKGFTCIRQWTLTNEPNGWFAATGYSFERFVEIHSLAREEFKQRGINIEIIGSDDAQSLPWFKACVGSPDYHDLTDLFVSHRYFQFPERPLIPGFLESRLSPLNHIKPLKDFVIGEFGFQDGKSGTMENPIMETFPYALWTADFVIEGLNRGVSGFSIWCLHEVYYPGGGFMNYGLWDFKDSDWKIRPVYHAWASFTRLTEPGDPVHVVESSHPLHFKAARVGGALFWVNLSEQPARARIDGFPAKEVRIHTEATLSGDRESGALIALESGGFEAPPMSFGYLR